MSEKKEYSIDLKDHLCKIYRFIEREKLQFSTPHVYIADNATSIGGGSMKFAEKFVQELESIKDLVSKQPVIEVVYEEFTINDKDEEVVVKTDIKETLRTFNIQKANNFIFNLDNKKEYYITKRIKSLKITDPENIMQSLKRT